LSADCRLAVTVRSTRDADEIEAAMELRIRVFCGEQGVSEEEETDELDAEATQIVAVDETVVVATCRLRYPEAGSCKLERMVVEKRLRGLGVGGRLLAGAEEEARSHGAERMVLNAQRRAEPFYAENGYLAEGEAFMEAGIEHVRMTKAL
jgi:predicted GNAT family N-acyltransferase